MGNMHSYSLELDDLIRLGKSLRRLKSDFAKLEDEHDGVLWSRHQLQVSNDKLVNSLTEVRKKLAQAEADNSAKEAELELYMRAFYLYKDILGAIVAAAGGEMFCDDLMLRNLRMFEFKLIYSETESGTTWKLELTPPEHDKDKIKSLAFQNFLKIMNANKKKK